MEGRLEHELRIKNNINKLLNTMPNCVSDYYYNIQISKEPTTCEEYLRKIHCFLQFANMDIANIDDTVIGRYFESINYTTDKNGEIHKTTFAHKQNTWSALNQFFEYLYKRKVIQKNPMTTTQRPKKDDNVKRLFLSMEDLNSILDSVKQGSGSHKAISRQKDWKERDLLIMFLFMNTGMRKTALSEINVEDISFSDKKLTVTDKRNKTQIYDITDEMERAIKVWLMKRDRLLNNENNDALFISSRRKRLSEKAIYNIVRKYSEQALGYAISPHKLRAAFVSLYYEASGGDIKATSQAVGHANVATTSIYIVKKNNSRTEAMNFMSRNLNYNNN